MSHTNTCHRVAINPYILALVPDFLCKTRLNLPRRIKTIFSYLYRIIGISHTDKSFPYSVCKPICIKCWNVSTHTRMNNHMKSSFLFCHTFKFALRVAKHSLITVSFWAEICPLITISVKGRDIPAVKPLMASFNYSIRKKI